MNFIVFKGLFIFCYLFSFVSISAQDWRMWRYDVGRTASSPNELPNELHLQWTRNYSQREMVWDDPLNHDLMQYDKVFEPIVLGKTLFVGFNNSDKIAAFDLVTGRLKW